MFKNLEANTNYSVIICMKNNAGEGPASSTFVKTLAEPDGIVIFHAILFIFRLLSLIVKKI